MNKDNFMYYTWVTEEYHHDNTVTLTDYVENHMGEEFTLLWQDGNYAGVRDNETMRLYGVTAYGRGDSFNHEVKFERYE